MERTFFTHWFFLFFLYTLMVLHLMWTYSIFMVAVNKLKKGDVSEICLPRLVDFGVKYNCLIKKQQIKTLVMIITRACMQFRLIDSYLCLFSHG